jgi:2-desacetyl-2-hydroxyethyl bacteriochlorophyllide A dehydrogenase
MLSGLRGCNRLARADQINCEDQPMLQVNIHAPGQFALDQVPAPTPTAHDVVVDVSACGICGSDLAYVAAGGLMGPSEQPMPLGHELAGTVAAVGAAVEGIRLGQRVVVNPMAGGNRIGNGGPEGGFAPQLLVRNAVLGQSLFDLPRQLSFEQGALVEPLAVAAHGINQAGSGPQSKVAVLGAGPIGLATVAVLKSRGVANIAVADLSAERLLRAEALGAAAVIDANRGPLGAQLMAVHGRGEVFGMPVADTDIYIDATGARSVVEAVLNSIKSGGTLIVLGLHKQDIPVSFSNILAREITIKGSMAYPVEFPEVIRLLGSGALDVAAMISHRYRLEQFHEAFAMASNTLAAAKVMVTMG